MNDSQCAARSAALDREVRISRRALLETSMLAALTSTTLLAQPNQRKILITPALPAGPNYPGKFQVEPLGNLIIGAPRGKSEPFTLAGIVTDTSGRAIERARVELWQCDGLGMYHHDYHSKPAQRDPGIVAYGWQRADGEGRFAFRTIRAIPCENHNPHFHVAVIAPMRPKLITQYFLPNHPDNEEDIIYRRLGTTQRDALNVALEDGRGLIRAALG
jgi:protocatechuate 3,4-dioxygenase, beta subunit